MDGEKFDPFGQPIVDRVVKRGRPRFEASEKDRNKVKLLLALGWANDRIANGVGVSLSTLKRYFRAELKVRSQMRDRLTARRFEIAMEQANTGNIAALRELGRLIDVNDRMQVEREMRAAAKTAGSNTAPAEKLGKKVISQQLAYDADADLMAELDGEAGLNARH